MCLFFGWVWLCVLEPPDTKITPHYTIGVYAIAVSCVIEMCVEPLYLVAQAFLFVRFKVSVQAKSIHDSKSNPNSAWCPMITEYNT